MQFIQWKKDYEVIPQIDEQHREIFSLANRVHEKLSEKVTFTEMEEVLIWLKNYTLKHFADEEVYMNRIGYPDLWKHKESHNYLRQQVDKKMDVLKGSISPDIVDLLSFFTDWLVNHILMTDMKIRKWAFAKAQMDK